MALECHKGKNSSLQDSGGCNRWEEEVSPTNFGSFRASSILISNSTEEAQTKSTVANSKYVAQSRKGIAKDGNLGVDCSTSNGHRSITDLPPALVSEIFHRLDAKELGIVSCVSTHLNNVASDHQGWKEFYCERWGQPSVSKDPTGSGLPEQIPWRELFINREFRSKVFMGRFSVDVLHGHTEAVRSVFLLPSANLIFTGGYDSIVRMWDMEEALSICASQPLGCTIRAISADNELLVAAGTGGFLQCWRAIEVKAYLFDLTGSISNQNSEFRLCGHVGPVTCLALDSSRIYSGSWDMTIRLWDRSQLKCVKVLRHCDWVWSLAPRGSTIASTAGGDVYIWDIQSGDQIIFIQNAHMGNSHALARSHSGHLLFTGGEDGVIHMFEAPRYPDDEDIKPVATWISHTGDVHSLAFEFPWLVSSSSDGRLALIDVRKLLKSSRCSSSRHKTRVCRSSQVSVEPPQRMLHGYGCNLFSVAIGADRIVCGSEEGVVRVWNFSQALEIEKRVRALKAIRSENRMRRRKVQIEMSSRKGRTDQCSVAAKRNQINGNRNGIWDSKRPMTGKLKT